MDRRPSLTPPTVVPGAPPHGTLDALPAPPPAAVEVDARGPVVLVRMSGEVDAACLAEARRALGALDAVAGHRPVLVDTHDVTFMDSSGIALLERVVRLCRSAAVPVALLDPATTVTEVLAVLGLDRWFPVVRSDARARA
ncbi:STAS domain-containing protein [Isoptericola sp. NPDC057653]|uniref:STAS domain-containing protein n=1 Tax=Isoptericola sp. NPDC057653 TaxID=3346195 RepID=UPI003697EB88